jgi:hypothetical protein
VSWGTATGEGESTECEVEGGREWEKECDAYGSDQSDSSESRLILCVEVVVVVVEEEGG